MKGTHSQPLDERLARLITGFGTSFAYLGIVHFASAKQRFQRIISRDEEACKVHKELAGNVEEDKEEVKAQKPKKSIDLWHGGLLFEIVEHGVLRKLR